MSTTTEAESRLAGCQLRVTKLEAEATGLETRRKEAEARRAALVPDSGPALRGNHTATLAGIQADRRELDGQLEAIASALVDCGREREGSIAELRAAEAQLTEVRRREAAALLLAHARDFDAALGAAGAAFATAVALGEQLGLGHVLSNSIFIGATAWANAPQVAHALHVSGRSEARPLATLLAQALAHLFDGSTP